MGSLALFGADKNEKIRTLAGILRDGGFEDEATLVEAEQFSRDIAASLKSCIEKGIDRSDAMLAERVIQQLESRFRE